MKERKIRKNTLESEKKGTTTRSGRGNRLLNIFSVTIVYILLYKHFLKTLEVDKHWIGEAKYAVTNED